MKEENYEHDEEKCIKKKTFLQNSQIAPTARRNEKKRKRMFFFKSKKILFCDEFQRKYA